MPGQLQRRPAGVCDANQFAQPFTAPNGDLYVVFQNFNNALTGDDNRNQMLLVKSTDGGVSFGPPVKVSDFYDLPDCLTYTGHDAFRSCVPTAPLSDRSIFRPPTTRSAWPPATTGSWSPSGATSTGTPTRSGATAARPASARTPG